MDNSSVGAGFMAVFAVSGSVALLALQLHKHVLSDFMKKFEFELANKVGSNKNVSKKKVRFSDDVTYLIDSNVRYKKHQSIMSEQGVEGSTGGRMDDEREFKTMPINRQVLYKGLIQFKCLKGYYI